MNLGYEEEELKPYLEPTADIDDPARIRKLQTEPTSFALCTFTCAVSP